MAATLIRVSGCDDATSAVIDLTPEQAELVRLVANIINANSLYECMPTMSVRDASPDDITAHQTDMEERREDYR